MALKTNLIEGETEVSPLLAVVLLFFAYRIKFGTTFAQGF